MRVRERWRKRGRWGGWEGCQVLRRGKRKVRIKERERERKKIEVRRNEKREKERIRNGSEK